jgi:DNA-binding MarR family transcriptional regulator
MNENPLAADTFHRLLKILRFLRQHTHKMKSEGISPRDYAVLRFLLESGPATVGEVQTYLHKSPSTTSTLIAQLEEAGYVSRTRSQKDNRVVVVELTPAGQEIAEETPLGGLPLLRHQLRKLPEDRLGHLNQALTEIMQLLEVPEGDEFS